MTHTCIVCGCAFVATHNKKTCSPKCAEENARRYRKRRWLETRQRPRQQTCEVCGAAFVRRSGNQRACSNRCGKVLWRRAVQAWKDRQPIERLRELARRQAAKRLARPTERIKQNLRRRLRQAFKDYSLKGKVRKSAAYGIDWLAIVRHLGPRPSKHHTIDHIVPLAAFNFDNPIEVCAAFLPENHQWLTAFENDSKNDAYVEADKQWLIARVIRSQAEGSATSTSEGSETRGVSSASDNRPHERPTRRQIALFA